MKETKFSKHVCGIITSGCGGHASRIESPDTSPGFPDLDYCVIGGEGNIELKVGSKIKMPELRPSQVRWFGKRNKAGGNPFFLCLNTDENEVYFVDGQWARELAGKQSIKTWKSYASMTWKWGDEFLVGLKELLTA